MLTTKVGIERVRLLLWGDSVGLSGLRFELGAGVHAAAPAVLDPRLQDRRIVKAVCDILSYMRQLFEDTNPMTRRYGLQSSQANQFFPGSLHNALITTFRGTYTRFRDAAGQRHRAATMATKARWAVKDKKRFERFIEDLRGFNDSLCALFPDLDEQVRQGMAAEIKSSTDLEKLQIVEQAVADMEANEELVEAASARITELSQHTQSLVDQGLDIEAIDEAGQTDESDKSEDDRDSSAIVVGTVNVNRLAKAFKKLEASFRHSLKASLQLSIWHSFRGRYTGFFTLEGVKDDEYKAQKDKEIEHSRHPYPSWSRWASELPE